MEKYIIYCTPEQTKKALELGAQIEMDSHSHGMPYIQDKTNFFICPTAEQMRGWIMDNGAIDFYVDRDLDEELNYCDTYGYVVSFSDKDRLVGTGINSDIEATIAAIDAALEYIEKHKK